MNKLTGAAVFLAGAVMAFQSAQAQNSFVPNDLYLGFQNSAGGGSADYIINLGSAASLITSSSTVNLTGDFSLATFQSASLFGNNSGAAIMGGVVGGSNAGNPSDLFVTQLRNGGPGSRFTAGSSLSGKSGLFADNTAYSDMGLIAAPGAGVGVLDTGLSWEKNIEPANAAGTFLGDTGINPDSAVNPSGVLYEDLWGTSSSGGLQSFTYDGYFTLDLSNSSASLTFTPAPEPSSYLLSGAGGILMLLLRSRLSRRNA
jgi:hypothetical protein